MPNPPRQKQLKPWQAMIVASAFVAIPTAASRFEWGPHILLGGIAVYVLIGLLIYRWQTEWSAAAKAAREVDE